MWYIKGSGNSAGVEVGPCKGCGINEIGKYTVHYEGFSCREGDACGRGDGGSPIIRECLLPRSEVETTRFRPFDDAACCALENFATGVSGDSGALMRIPTGLEDDESTVASPSVVSVPLSS